MKLFILGGLIGLLNCGYHFASVRLDHVNKVILLTEIFVHLQLGTMLCSVIRQLRIANGGGVYPLLLSVVAGGFVGACVAFLILFAYWAVLGTFDRIEPWASGLIATTFVALCWAFSFQMIGIMTTPGGQQRPRSSLRADYDDWE